jgi:hypothetical protein
VDVTALARRVELLMDGMPFEAVESEIERMRLGEEQKSALWLYAWSLQDESRRRAVLTDALSYAL